MLCAYLRSYSDSMPLPLLTAAAGGLLFQLTLSAINEVPTIKFLGICAGLEALLLGYLLKSGAPGLLFSFFRVNAIFISVWVVATVMRRLYFSPLCKFPGKKVAAVSKLYEAKLFYNGRHSTEVRRLHRELGDVVRTGPNEISICNVDAIKLLGRKNYDSRGPFYEVASAIGDYSVLTIRQNSVHRKWRSIWLLTFC
jgi:hypothetical protein